MSVDAGVNVDAGVRSSPSSSPSPSSSSSSSPSPGPGSFCLNPEDLMRSFNLKSRE